MVCYKRWPGWEVLSPTEGTTHPLLLWRTQEWVGVACQGACLSSKGWPGDVTLGVRVCFPLLFAQWLPQLVCCRLLGWPAPWRPVRW